MSAFLYFSQGKRSVLKEQNPSMKNTEVSRLLGEMWRNCTDDEKRPFVDKEKTEREKYKIAMAEWKKDFEAKQEAQRNAQQAAAGANNNPALTHHAPYAYQNPYGEPQYGHAAATMPYQYHNQYPYGKCPGSVACCIQP